MVEKYKKRQRNDKHICFVHAWRSFVLRNSICHRWALSTDVFLVYLYLFIYSVHTECFFRLSLKRISPKRNIWVSVAMPALMFCNRFVAGLIHGAALFRCVHGKWTFLRVASNKTANGDFIISFFFYYRVHSRCARGVCLPRHAPKLHRTIEQLSQLLFANLINYAHWISRCVFLFRSHHSLCVCVHIFIFLISSMHFVVLVSHRNQI